MARPRKEIDQEQFEKLCAIQCTETEIANWFKCSVDTIERWCRETYQDENDKPMSFAEVFKVYSVDGKISLRRYQFRQAEKSYAMAIWLGKQWLGQRDNMDMSVESRQSADVEALNEYFRQRNKERAAGLSD